MAKGAPIAFTAPASAQSVSTNRIDLIPNADLTGQKLTLPMAIPPGESDLRPPIIWRGHHPASPSPRTLDYAATKLQVLVSDSRQALNSQTLHNDGPIQAPQGATPFRQFSADNVQAGQTYDMLIGPSPATPATGTTARRPRARWQRIRDRATVPFLLALALICLALIFFVLRAPQRVPQQHNGTGLTTMRPRQTHPAADDAVAEPVATSADSRATRRSRGQAARLRCG